MSEKISEILKAVKDFLAPDMSEIKERLAGMEEKVAGIEKQLQPLSGLPEEVAGLKAEVRNNREQSGRTEDKVDRLLEGMTDVRERLVRVETKAEDNPPGGTGYAVPRFLKEDS